MSKEKWDGKLGNTSFNVEYLQSVTQKEAVEALTTAHIHKDRVINAWKRANGKK